MKSNTKSVFLKLWPQSDLNACIITFDAVPRYPTMHCFVHTLLNSALTTPPWLVVLDFILYVMDKPIYLSYPQKNPDKKCFWSNYEAFLI